MKDWLLLAAMLGVVGFAIWWAPIKMNPPDECFYATGHWCRR